MGGTGVLVGVLAGCGVLVKVGTCVSVGMGVSVGVGANELHDVDIMTRTESNIAVPMIFIDFLTVTLMFWYKPSGGPTTRSDKRGQIACQKVNTNQQMLFLSRWSSRTS